MSSNENGKTAVVSFRVREFEAHMLRAAAARRNVFLSDWVRDAAMVAVRQELGAEQTGESKAGK